MPLLLALLLAAAVPALGADEPDTEAAGLRFSVPDGWERVQPSSPLRAAQLRIPHARGDDDDGDVILFRFDDARAGSVSDVEQRWYAQIGQPDGRPSREVAAVTTRAVGDLTVKVIDVSGVYRPQMGPMEHTPKPGYRLLGAIVQGPGGPWYWRAVGPARTMAAAKPGFDTLVGSLAPRR